MLYPALENGRGIAEQRIEVLEGRARFEPPAVHGAPENTIAEDLVLRGMAAGEREPLHVVGREDVIAHRKIDACVGRGNRHDGGKMGRELLGRGPLIIARVGTTPHRDFAVAIRLPRQPLHDVVAVVGLLEERFELPLGIAPAAHIDAEKWITVRRKIHTPVVIALRDVGSERENARRGRLLVSRRVDVGAQADTVAQRYLHIPVELDVRRVRNRRHRLVGARHRIMGARHGCRGGDDCQGAQCLTQDFAVHARRLPV